jgi:hypothetical protein
VRKGKRRSGPVWTALTIVVLGMAVAQYAQLYSNALTFPVPRITVGDIGFGFDFLPYYQAARVWLRGGNPYLVQGTTTPPLSILVVMPLTSLDFVAASYLNAIAATLAMMAAVALVVVAARGTLRLGRDWPFFLLLVLSYPFSFLVSRGNVEYWVWLLVAVGLWSAATRKSAVVTGTMFGLGALLKLYPLVFIVPLVANRRRNAAAVAVAVVIAGLTVPHTYDFVAGSLGERLARRVDLYQNASLTGLFHYALAQVGLADLRPARAAALTIYGLALGSCCLLDWRAPPPATGRWVGLSLALYAPFIGAIPDVAYCYVLVGLILALPWIEDAWWSGAAEPSALLMFAVGAALAFAPICSTSYALREFEPVHLLPPLGNSLCMLAALRLKWKGITSTP